jgi:RNA polymerase sigma-70 factor (ECF subfamily)
MENVNDLFYVQRVKSGDHQAFTAIVSKYGKMVFTVVRKIVENREEAEDITQEVFIKIFKSLERFREESEFSTWIYRIAYNTTISELRKRKLFFVVQDEALLTDNGSFTDGNEDEEIEIKLQYLEEALKKLSPDEIFLVTLHYMDGQSIDSISRISGLSVSNIKVKLHRIRRKLAVEIDRLNSK